MCFHLILALSTSSYWILELISVIGCKALLISSQAMYKMVINLKLSSLKTLPISKWRAWLKSSRSDKISFTLWQEWWIRSLYMYRMSSLNSSTCKRHWNIGIITQHWEHSTIRGVSKRMHLWVKCFNSLLRWHM